MWVRRSALITCLTAAFTAVMASGAIGVTGDLDSSFDGDGKRVIDFGGDADAANTVLMQSDGKIILTGNGQPPGATHAGMVAARLSPDGSTDTSFAGGTAFVDPGADGGSSAFGTFAPDGKIVMGTTTLKTQSGTLGDTIGRLNPDGTPDTTFSSTAIRTVDFGGILTGVAVQATGKIVFVGFKGFGSDWQVGRLTTNGHYDGTFTDARGGTGLLTLDTNGGGPQSVAVQPDGKLVILGNNKDGELLLVRLLPDGVPDANFGPGGVHDLGTTGGARALVLQPDGKIVIAVQVAGKTFRVARLNQDGTPDAGFGTNGITDVGFSGTSNPTALALQPDGKIVAAGLSGNDMAVARLQPGGALDTTFSGDGKQLIDFDADVDRAGSVAIAPDGDIVVAGRKGATSSPGNVAVARLQGDPAGAGGGPGGGGPGGGGGNGSALRCAGKTATIVGTSGRDRLRGTSHADVIVALGGNDTISGLDGNDTICGGAGNDKISGGDGSDREYGEAGRDTLSGGDGKDKLSGGTGDDKLSGGDGKDTLSGGGGKDKLSGGDGKDSLNGGGGKDSCSGEKARSC